MSSGGSDNVVCLWRVASCSSASWLGTDPASSSGKEEDDKLKYENEDISDDALEDEYPAPGLQLTDSRDPPDLKVRHIDQHEESVYSVAWSPAEAWVYASLSIDGR